MKETNIWFTLHILIAVLFLIKGWIFYRSKDGIVRKVFISISAVMAYYFIFIAFFRNIGWGYDISMIFASTPVFIISFISLYQLRRYSKQHKTETYLVKHELDKATGK